MVILTPNHDRKGVFCKALVRCTLPYGRGSDLLVQFGEDVFVELLIADDFS